MANRSAVENTPVERSRPAKRKHVRTGRKPPGGKRPGAGRPEGSSNALPTGAVAAIKSLNLRVPKGARPEEADLANEALETVVTVMRGKVRSPGLAFARLTAARAVREEVCGKVPDKVQVAGEGGGPLTITVHRAERAAPPVPATPPTGEAG